MKPLTLWWLPEERICRGGVVACIYFSVSWTNGDGNGRILFQIAFARHYYFTCEFKFLLSPIPFSVPYTSSTTYTTSQSSETPNGCFLTYALEVLCPDLTSTQKRLRFWRNTELDAPPPNNKLMRDIASSARNTNAQFPIWNGKQRKWESMCDRFVSFSQCQSLTTTTLWLPINRWWSTLLGLTHSLSTRKESGMVEGQTPRKFATLRAFSFFFSAPQPSTCAKCDKSSCRAPKRGSE